MKELSTTERADAILDELRTSLSSDGYGLRLDPADDGGILVTVSADSDTCADCLVPVDLFRGIVSTMLQKGGLDIERIDVSYPSTAH